MIRLLVRHPTAANLLMLTFVLLGLLGLPELRRETYPEFEPSTIVIRASYPGADAEIVDELLVQAIEDAIAGLDGIDSIRSQSRGRVTTTWASASRRRDASASGRVSAVRPLLALPILLAACRAEPEPTRVEPHKERKPAKLEDADATRKHECVESALRGADPRYGALIRSLCAEWVERDIPGVSLAIVEPDEPPFTLALGQRCFGEEGLVEPGTPFRFGSISKTFTAALALGLVAEGRLTLAARASEHVAGFQTQAGLPDPTLELLLRHRSGLGDIRPDQLVELGGAWLPALARSPAAGVVGEHHYSNTGYSVIGAMLSSASENDFAALLDDRIARPLELPSITAVPTQAQAPACGHLEHDRDRHPISVSEDLAFMPGDPRWMDPAGGVLGSAVDLARFALALGTDRLPGTAAMLEPGDPLPPTPKLRDDERYGYGLRSWALHDDARAYGHSGNNVAFAAELLFVPNHRAIVLLANCGAGLPASLAAAEQLLARP